MLDQAEAEALHRHGFRHDDGDGVAPGGRHGGQANARANKLEVEDFELLRAGINDSANLLADDELSELFGGYRSCQPGYCEKNYKNGRTAEPSTFHTSYTSTSSPRSAE